MTYSSAEIKGAQIVGMTAYDNGFPRSYNQYGCTHLPLHEAWFTGYDAAESRATSPTLTHGEYMARTDWRG